MASKTFLCLALILGLVLSASPALACDDAVFGPREHSVGWLRLHSSVQSFKVTQAGDGLIEISRVSAKSRIYNGLVILNDQFISLYPILGGKASKMQAAVQLRKRNYLLVFLYGEKGAAIRIKIKRVKQEQTNQPPIANTQDVELDEDAAASITLTGSDQDGDSLTFGIVSGPAHGTLSGTPPALTYAPLADYNGPDSFTFKVNDGKMESQPATVNITVNPVNDAPRAVATSPGEARVGEEVSLDGSESSDVDADQLSYVWKLISYPAPVEPTLVNGTASVASFLPYLPGTYKVQLVVNDGTTDSPADTVTVSVAYPPFSLTVEKLMAGDGAAGARFGSSVSVDNNRAIIGAEGKGAAYIFESASPWSQKNQLGSGQAGDLFGSAVAISGDYALVGASGDDELDTDSGAAYMFRWDGSEWTQTQKLYADKGNAGAGDFFGAAVSLSVDYAVVGAYSDDTGEDEWVTIFGQKLYVAGNAYTDWDDDLRVWKGNAANQPVCLKPKFDAGWPSIFDPKAIKVSHNDSSGSIKLLQILNTDRTKFDTYLTYPSRTPFELKKFKDIGEIQAYYPPAAITNIEFLVSSTGGGKDAGSAYVFKREATGWVRDARLTASDGSAGDEFGISVAVSGQTIIVGAVGDDDNGENSGSAYVFVQDGAAWAQEAKLLASDGQAKDQFGSSVAISGDIAVVGAPGGDAAYVFWYNGEKWTEEARLSGEKEGDLFGASVSISGTYLVVGAPNAGGSGAMYVYRFDGFGWVLEGKAVATDAADGQRFGGSVSISGDVILSGAAGDGNEAGAAYAYTIDTYHTATISAEPTTGGNPLLSWSWVNALFVDVGPGIVSSAVPLEGSGSAVVSPAEETTYTITAYGPYGKDVASVTVLVEP